MTPQQELQQLIVGLQWEWENGVEHNIFSSSPAVGFQKDGTLGVLTPRSMTI
jgi:hypothetical protein